MEDRLQGYLPNFRGEGFEGDLVEVDFSGVDEDVLLGAVKEASDPQVGMLVHQDTPLMEILGYDTDSDEDAHLCCSECGEPVEFVAEEPDTDDVPEGIPDFLPQVRYLGAVCGCRETPGKWSIDGT